MSATNTKFHSKQEATETFLKNTTLSIQPWNIFGLFQTSTYMTATSIVLLIYVYKIGVARLKGKHMGWNSPILDFP